MRGLLCIAHSYPVAGMGTAVSCPQIIPYLYPPLPCFQTLWGNWRDVIEEWGLEIWWFSPWVEVCRQSFGEGKAGRARVQNWEWMNLAEETESDGEVRSLQEVRPTLRWSSESFPSLLVLCPIRPHLESMNSKTKSLISRWWLQSIKLQVQGLFWALIPA